MHRSTSASGSALLSSILWLAVAACSSPDGQSQNGGSGGASTTDTTGSGGRPATGGTSGGAGGATDTSASGGTTTSGGRTGSGGAGSGGATASGGRTGDGGSSGSGGATASGGSSRSGGAPGTGGASLRRDAGPGGTGGAADAGPAGGTTTAAGGSAGGTVIEPTACSSGTAQSGDVTVNLAGVQQRISGFGVSSAWAGNFNDPAKDPDTLWSTTTGAGLTLHRIRIGAGTTSETKIAQKAVTYGVKVWAAPWEVDAAYTDRAMCPTNDACTPPPKLIDPAGWANRLAGFVKTMKDAGVDLYAISAENEPDSKGLNHTVPFTPDELATWIGSYLGPALAPLGVKVMAPETMNGCGFPGYFSAIQKNPAAWEHVAIFASHEYGCGTLPSQPAIAAAGKEYWETEVDTGSTSDDPSCDGMGSALKLAETIHNDLTKPNLNAWHYWWLYAGGCSGLFDTTTKVWTKRFWIMGNFSRFVRPGFVRVSTLGSAPAGVLVSAYKNPADGTVAVVAINKNSSATPLSLFVSGVVPCAITPWVTSDSESIVSKAAIAVTSARFSASLPPKSVTTFVGKPE